MIASGVIRANERVRLVRKLPNLCVDSDGVVRGASASVTGARYVVGRFGDASSHRAGPRRQLRANVISARAWGLI
jgi:hypothetical protein